MKSIVKKAAIILFWVLVWGIAAHFIHNTVYFAGPVEVLREFIQEVQRAVFWKSIGLSVFRILTGFLIAAFGAWLFALLSWRFSVAEEFFSPVIALLRSVPVAGVVVILLIWYGSENLVYFITFMVVFPNVYGTILSGLKNTETELEEMAEVFRIPFYRRFFWIYRPAYFPALLSSIQVSIGMSFKSGVAAEIIGLPQNTIGEQLYRNKIYINVAGVFVWIIVILLISFLAEKLILGLLNLSAKIPLCVANGKKADSHLRDEHSIADGQDGKGTEHSPGIEFKELAKSYNGKEVLHISGTVPAASAYGLMGVSGSGKTTLLHLLAGIRKADGGEMNYTGKAAGECRIAMVFQEDRLIRHADPVQNLRIAGCKGDIEALLGEILPVGLLHRPVKELSGGERRRVDIARAVLCESDILLLDEPFTGLDETNRSRMAGWILTHRNGRTLLFATHNREELALLGAEGVVTIEK